MTVRFLTTTLAVLLLGTATYAQPKQSLPPDLAAIPGNAVGFVHIRVADIWKSDALKETRDTVLLAGKQAIDGFDKRFLPTPSSIDRLTVVMLPRGEDLSEEPVFFALLTLNKTFDRDELLKSAMPDGVETKTTNGSYWVQKKQNIAATFIDNKSFAFGPTDAIKLFVDQRSAGPGPMSELLKSADLSRHITVGGNLAMIPQRELRDVPPPFLPLMAAKTALLSLDLSENTKFDLTLNYADEAAARKAMTATQDLTTMGRDFIKKSKPEMLKTAIGDGTPSTLDKLPEAAMAVVALGAMERADMFLANPPVKQDGRALKMSMAVPLTSYATMAPIAVGLMLPAVQKVREAAARAQSQNNLKQIGIAIHTYHDTIGHLPPPIVFDKAGKPLYSGFVELLPFIEQQNMYNRIKRDEPWNSEDNKKVSKFKVRTFASRDAPEPEKMLRHYRFIYGNGAMFDEKGKVTLNMVNDGLSNTIMAVETEEGVDWMKPDEILYDPKKPLPKFGFPGRGGFNVLMGDGSVRFIPATTPEATIRAMITRDGGEVVP